MSQRRAAWISAALCWTGFAFAEAPLKIMPLGDSLTAGGYNLNRQWHIDGGYREHLFRELSALGHRFDFVGPLSDGGTRFADPEHAGYSGWRIDQVDAIANSLLDTYRPSAVLLMLGTNDIIQNHQVGTAHERLGVLIRKILDRRPGVKLMVASIPTTNNVLYNARIRGFNQRLELLVRDLKRMWPNLHWVEMFGESGLTGSPQDMTDGVHPTGGGYQKLSTVWLNALKRAQVFPRTPRSAAPSSGPSSTPSTSPDSRAADPR